MKNSIWIRLVLPLTLLFVFALFINSKWKADGFFINLATEVIGIILTVSYVDWAFQLHEKNKWQTTDVRIANRLMSLLNGIITKIREGLGISHDVLDRRVIATGDITLMHKEAMRIGQDIIPPIVFQQLSNLDQRGWQLLSTNIQNASNEISSFLGMFQGRLSPNQISTLLDIQEKLQDSLFFYILFPDLAGVPEAKIPETQMPAISLQETAYRVTTKDIQLVLKLSLILSNTIIKNA